MEDKYTIHDRGEVPDQNIVTDRHPEFAVLV